MKVNISKVVRTVDNLDASSKSGEETLYHVAKTAIHFEVTTDSGERITGVYEVEREEAQDILDISCLIKNLFNRK